MGRWGSVATEGIQPQRLKQVIQESMNHDAGNSAGTVNGTGCGKESNQGYTYDMV